MVANTGIILSPPTLMIATKKEVQVVCNIISDQQRALKATTQRIHTKSAYRIPSFACNQDLLNRAWDCLQQKQKTEKIAKTQFRLGHFWAVRPSVTLHLLPAVKPRLIALRLLCLVLYLLECFAFNERFHERLSRWSVWATV